MSDSFGVFEASLHDAEAQQRTAAADSLAAAVYDAREKFGEFLGGATDVRDFRDRIALCKDDLIKTIEPHVFPRTGVIRRVAKQLEREFVAARKTSGEILDPEGDFHGYLDDVSGNDREKVDANVFVGDGIPHTGDPADTVFVTPKESSRRQAGPFGVQFYPGSMDDYFDAVHQDHAEQAARRSYEEAGEDYDKAMAEKSFANLHPDDVPGYNHPGSKKLRAILREHNSGPAIEGKEASLRQAGEHSVDQRYVPVRTRYSDPTEDPDSYSDAVVDEHGVRQLPALPKHRQPQHEAIEHFGSWCRAKNVRPSLNTLDRYASRGLPDRDYFAIVSAMQRGAAEHRLDEVGGSGRPAINPYTGDDSGAFKGNPEGHGHWDKDDRTPQSAYTDENGNAWAKGYTPDAEDVKARNRLKDPRSGELSPGESWGGPRHGARRTAAEAPDYRQEILQGQLAQQKKVTDHFNGWAQNQLDAYGLGPDHPRHQETMQGLARMHYNEFPEMYGPNPNLLGEPGNPDWRAAIDRKLNSRESRRRTAAPDYLQKANDALTGLLNQEAETFQEQIAPMQQALTVVQQALAEQQQANPFNVMPGGAINVMPGADQGGGGLPSQSPPPGAPMDPSMMGGGDPSAMGADPSMMGGGAPPMDPSMMPPQDSTQQMMAAAGISRQMVGMAMSRKHYRVIADAIRNLPEEHRGGISESLAGAFKADNPNFNHAKFYEAAGYNPNKTARRRRRLASGQEVQWEGKACPDCVMAIANGDDSGAGPEWSWEKLDQHTQGIPGEGPLIVGDDEPWFGRGPCDTCGSPYDGDFHRVVRLGPRATRKRGGRGKVSPRKGSSVRLADVLKDWEEWNNRLLPKGNAPMGGEPDFEQFARETGAGQRAIQKLRTHLMGQGRSASYVEDLQAAGENHPDQGIRDRFQKGHWERTKKDDEDKPKVRDARRKQACGPYESFAACVADNQDKSDPSAYCGALEQRTKKGSTKQAWMGWNGGKPEQHKVAGWDWDDHLSAYTSSSPRVFLCSCGDAFDTPSNFHRCACGKQWNSYVIGTGGDRKEASAEKYLVREIPTRKDVIVASKTADVDTELDESIGDEVKAQDDYTHRAEDAEQAGRDDVADRYREVRKDEENHEREFRELESNFARYVGEAYVARESAITKLTEPGEITEVEETGTPTMKPMPPDWARRNPDGKWNTGPVKKSVQ